MSVVPFRWQGKSRVERLRAVVRSRSAEWLKGWSSALPTCEVTVLPDGAAAENRVGDIWYTASGSHGRVHGRVAQSAQETLGCRLLGVPTPDGRGLAAGVGRRAISDLLSWLTGLTEAMVGMDGRPELALLRSRAGTLGLLWSLDGVRAELYLDATLCDHLLPDKVVAKTPLVMRDQAILPCDLPLVAVIDLGKARLGEALTLRPGEIIKTDVALDALVSIQSPAGETLFNGTLVAADGRRAVRCISKTMDQGGT